MNVMAWVSCQTIMRKAKRAAYYMLIASVMNCSEHCVIHPCAWCVCVQWADCAVHLLPDQGAVELWRGTLCCLLHCHRCVSLRGQVGTQCCF